MRNHAQHKVQCALAHCEAHCTREKIATSFFEGWRGYEREEVRITHGSNHLLQLVAPQRTKNSSKHWGYFWFEERYFLIKIFCEWSYQRYLWILANGYWVGHRTGRWATQWAILDGVVNIIVVWKEFTGRRWTCIWWIFFSPIFTVLSSAVSSQRWRCEITVASLW